MENEEHPGMRDDRGLQCRSILVLVYNVFLHDDVVVFCLKIADDCTKYKQLTRAAFESGGWLNEDIFQ